MAVHRNFLDSVGTLKRSLVRSIFYLRIIQDRRIHKALGYGTILEYASREAGLGRRQCESFLTLGRKLGNLPRLTARLAAGQLTWRQAEAISRVAAPETESAWIAAAARLSLHDLDAATRSTRKTETDPPGRAPNELNTSLGVAAATVLGAVERPRPQPRVGPAHTGQEQAAPDTPHYVTFKFTAEQFALWEAWFARSRGSDAKLGKEALLCAALEGGPDTGGHVLRTVLQLCPDCRAATIPTGRGDCLATSALLERAACDGEIQKRDGRLRQIVPPRLRRSILARDGHRCRAEGCRHIQHLQMHHLLPVSAGGETRTENLVTLCSSCHRALHEGEIALKAQMQEAP